MSKAVDAVKGLFRRMFSDELEIRHRLLNLVLVSVILGGTASLIVTLFLDSHTTALLTLIMILISVLSLFLSVKKNLKNVPAFIMLGTANVIFFPIMFFTSGGFRSGMILWFSFGLIFNFIMLKGRTFWIMLILSCASVLVVTHISVIYPDLVAIVTDEYMQSDILQSLFFVVGVVGVIFKYQTFVYERQKAHLIAQEEKLLETMDELKEASLAKSRFLANMSHEIRTPINGILGMDAMLLKECTNEYQRECAANIKNAGQTLLYLVNDILDISKIESGKMEMSEQEYDIFSVFSDCYHMIADRASRKNLKFTVEINPKLPSKLYGDDMRLRQILNNLLSNAVKYTEKGGFTLYCDFECVGDNNDEIVINAKVVDTGIGIKDVDKNKLFGEFVRLEESRNRSIEGTGLGLNLTHKLVQLMNGTISVESEYGKGSTFAVSIPQKVLDKNAVIGNFNKRLNEYSAAIKIEESKSFKAPEAEILVVDDVDMNLKVVKGLLKDTEIKIDIAMSGERCLKLAAEKKYDMIFLDCMMPVMDGVETFRRLRSSEECRKNADTPVIMLTANAVHGAREEYLDIGFNDYLSKPVRERELKDMLKKFLNRNLIKGDSSETPVEVEPVVEEIAAETASDASEIPGVDIAVGMRYCLDDKDFFIEMIGAYIENDKREELKNFFAAKDWDNYRIVIHGIKSTSLTIGASNLSENAKALEMACKGGDEAYILANHDAVMAEYDKMLADLKAYHEKNS